MNYRDFNLDDWIGHISGVIEDETTLDGNEMRDLVEFLTTLKQYPTTKNDLGIDCISRQDVLSEIIRFSTEEGSSVECQQLYCDVNNMSSVTPIKPKGHWQKIELPSRDAHECSECCGLALLDENNEQLTDFCPNCGADMRGEEE